MAITCPPQFRLKQVVLARTQPGMLAASRCLLSWRFQQVIGCHNSNTAFEATIFPAAAGMMLVALWGETASHQDREDFLSYKDRLYERIALGCLDGIREILDCLARVFASPKISVATISGLSPA